MNTKRRTTGSDYYTAGKVKEILGITNGKLYNYADNGTLERHFPPGSKQAVYKKDQVDKLAHDLKIFIAVRKKKPTQFTRVETREEMIECQEISQALFGVGRSTVDDRMRLLRKNPDTYHLLKDEDDVIGYAALMPLKTGRLEDVLKQTIPVQISLDDIEDFSENKTIDLYLHAMGIRPGFSTAEKHTYGARLVAGIMDVIIEWGKQGVVINTIAARSNMPDGIRLMKHMGFTEIERLTPERRTFVIHVKESGIPFILQYKKALEEAKHPN
jgi:hypothetical protein